MIALKFKAPSGASTGGKEVRARTDRGWHEHARRFLASTSEYRGERETSRERRSNGRKCSSLSPRRRFEDFDLLDNVPRWTGWA